MIYPMGGTPAVATDWLFGWAIPFLILAESAMLFSLVAWVALHDVARIGALSSAGGALLIGVIYTILPSLALVFIQDMGIVPGIVLIEIVVSICVCLAALAARKRDFEDSFLIEDEGPERPAPRAPASDAERAAAALLETDDLL